MKAEVKQSKQQKWYSEGNILFRKSHNKQLWCCNLKCSCWVEWPTRDYCLNLEPKERSHIRKPLFQIKITFLCIKLAAWRMHMQPHKQVFKILPIFRNILPSAGPLTLVWFFLQLYGWFFSSKPKQCLLTSCLKIWWQTTSGTQRRTLRILFSTFLSLAA